MHYQINNQITIKSENAAKPILQSNKTILNYISRLPSNSTVLDYGCGKLRYSIPLCNKVKKVIAIDSNEQISRVQTINNTRTTILTYAQKIPNLFVFDVFSNEWKILKYDNILCCNVLSAIPSLEDRMGILNNIKSVLSIKGEALISVQYRNSYFKQYNDNKNSSTYYDGWIINNRGNYSFYGMVSPNSLIDYCNKANLNIRSMKLIDGSAYCLVNKI